MQGRSSESLVQALFEQHRSCANIDASMSDARKVRQGQRRGEGRGADEGKGSACNLGLLTRSCTKRDFRPLKVKTGFDVESQDANNETHCNASSLSTTVTVALASGSARSVTTAASAWIKLATTAPSPLRPRSCLGQSILPDRSDSPWNPLPFSPSGRAGGPWYKSLRDSRAV